MNPRDILFLLKPDFFDGAEEPFYCPECAEVTGILEFYPHLREKLDARMIEFRRPRVEIVAILGPENQSCPVLVPITPDSSRWSDLVSGEFQKRKFITGARAIGQYLSRVYGIGRPH